MAKVDLASVIVPDRWNQYIIERSTQKNNFVRSGVIEQNEDFNERVRGESQTVNMPFWQSLTGSRQYIRDDADFSTKGASTSKDVAVKNLDGDAFSWNMLAKHMSGSDPKTAIGELLADYWRDQDNAYLLSLLKGVRAAFMAEGTPPNVLNIAVQDEDDIDATTVLNGRTFLKAIQKLGDAKDNLTAIGVHSETESYLAALQLIATEYDGDADMIIRSFMDTNVIMADELPITPGSGSPAADIYTSYLFGRGAIAQGIERLTEEPLMGGFGTEGMEWTRNALGHDTVMIMRRKYIRHVRGVKWKGTVQAHYGAPTDAQLEDAANWERVFKQKNIRLVFLNHNLEP